MSDLNAVIFEEPSARVLHLLVESLVERCAALADVAQEAASVQWHAAPIPRPRDDTAERSKGGHGDPTSAIAFDPRRLAVRESVDRAVLELAKSLDRVSAAEADVKTALDRWAGGAR